MLRSRTKPDRSGPSTALPAARSIAILIRSRSLLPEGTTAKDKRLPEGIQRAPVPERVASAYQHARKTAHARRIPRPTGTSRVPFTGDDTHAERLRRVALRKLGLQTRHLDRPVDERRRPSAMRARDERTSGQRLVLARAPRGLGPLPSPRSVGDAVRGELERVLVDEHSPGRREVRQARSHVDRVPTTRKPACSSAGATITSPEFTPACTSGKGSSGWLAFRPRT
jgi:hypothetical protein